MESIAVVIISALALAGQVGAFVLYDGKVQEDARKETVN